MKLVILVGIVIGALLAKDVKADPNALVDTILKSVKAPDGGLNEIPLPEQILRFNKTILQFLPVWGEARLRDGNAQGVENIHRHSQVQIISSNSELLVTLIIPQIQFMYRGTTYFWEIPFATVDTLNYYKDVLVQLRLSVKNKKVRLSELQLQFLPDVESRTLENGFWIWANFIIHYEIHAVTGKVNQHMNTYLSDVFDKHIQRLNLTSTEFMKASM